MSDCVLRWRFRPIALLVLAGCDTGPKEPDDLPCEPPPYVGEETSPSDGHGVGEFHTGGFLEIVKDARDSVANAWVAYRDSYCPEDTGDSTEVEDDTGCDDAFMCGENSGAHLLRNQDLCMGGQTRIDDVAACATRVGHPVGVAGDMDADGAVDVVMANVADPGLLVVSSLDCTAILLTVTQRCGLWIESVAGGGDPTDGDTAVLVLTGFEDARPGAFDEHRVWLAPASARGVVSLDGLDTRLVVPMAVDEDHAAVEGAVRDVTGDGLADVVVLVVGDAESAVGIGSGPVSLDVEAVADVVLGASGSYAQMAAGDLDGDGYADLALSRRRTEGGPDVPVLSGPFVAARDFDGATLQFEGAPGGLGPPIAMGADMTGDGLPDLVVGDSEYSDATGRGFEVGAVYLFSGPGSGTLTAADADATIYGDVDDAGLLGRDLSLADVTGDGLLDLIIVGETTMGEVLLFQGQ